MLTFLSDYILSFRLSRRGDRIGLACKSLPLLVLFKSKLEAQKPFYERGFKRNHTGILFFGRERSIENSTSLNIGVVGKVPKLPRAASSFDLRRLVRPKISRVCHRRMRGLR